jgi:(E)-4-hydroxy-3-methylbut-2-enyl-diphosphate synthase
MEPTALNMIKAAKMHVSILEELNFTNIVLSLKASSIDLSYEAYKIASEEFNYPLHIGITEAGTMLKGVIKSTIGLTKILNLGIGDTIRVSLTDDPVNEVIAAKEILSCLHLKDNVPTFTSCPTCGRCQYDMIPIAKEIENYLNTIESNIHVAVMGCAVNGPGEAREADLGVAGGNGEALLFKKGEIIRKIPQHKIVDEMIKEINLLINK